MRKFSLKGLPDDRNVLDNLPDQSAGQSGQEALQQSKTTAIDRNADEGIFSPVRAVSAISSGIAGLAARGVDAIAGTNYTSSVEKNNQRFQQSVSDVNQRMNQTADKYQQQHQANLGYGDISNSITRDTGPTVIANAVKGASQIFGGISHTAEGISGTAGAIFPTMFGSPQESQKSFQAGLNSFGKGAQGLADIWSGTLGILAAPAPLLPDYVEKPLADAFGAAAGAIDTGASHGLHFIGVDPDSEGGKILRQNIQNAFGSALLKVKPGKVAEGVVNTGKAVAEKTLSPFKESYDAQAGQAFQEAGITPTASMVSKSRVINMLETIQSKGFFGKKLANVAEQAKEGIQKFVQKHVEETTKYTNQLETGNALVDSFHNFKSGFEEQKNSLYNQLDQYTTGVPAVLDRTMSILDKIEEQQKQSSWGENPLSSKMQQMRQDFSQGRTFEQLKATRTAIGEELKATNDPVVTKNKGALKQLYNALSDDMEATATVISPEVGSLLKQTNEMYKTSIEKLNSYYGRKIFNADDQKVSTGPENLVDTLLKPKQYSKLPAVLEVLGEDGSNALRGGFLMKLAEESKVNGEFSPTKFATALDKYGDDFQRNLFTDSQYRNLQLVKTMSESYTKAQKLSIGSQTAFLGKASFAAANIFVNPGLVIGGAILDYGMTKFLESNFGKQYLGEGFYKGKQVPADVQTGAPPKGFNTAGTAENAIKDTLLSEVEYLGNIKKGDIIKNPNKTIAIQKLDNATMDAIHSPISDVSITRKVLKHIIEQRGDLAKEIIAEIPDILQHHSKLIDNVKKRPNSYLFVKMNGKAKGAVLEVIETKNGNQIVSAFPIDRKSYFKMKDILGRPDVPSSTH